MLFWKDTYKQLCCLWFHKPYYYKGLKETSKGRFVCVCVCVYMYMYMCVYIYIHTHTHTHTYIHTWEFPGSSVVKNPLAMQEMWVQSLGWKIPWRRKWQPIPVFLLGNPMDRGAWQTIVHGVSKSWTWLSIQIFYKESTMDFLVLFPSELCELL